MNIPLVRRKKKKYVFTVDARVNLINDVFKGSINVLKEQDGIRCNNLISKYKMYSVVNYCASESSIFKKIRNKKNNNNNNTSHKDIIRLKSNGIILLMSFRSLILSFYKSDS